MLFDFRMHVYLFLCQIIQLTPLRDPVSGLGSERTANACPFHISYNMHCMCNSSKCIQYMKLHGWYRFVCFRYLWAIISIALACKFNAHHFNVSACQHLLMDAPPAFFPHPCPSSLYMHEQHQSQKSRPHACHQGSIMSVFAWRCTASLLWFFLPL